MSSLNRPAAFTLIELLVVITIIVVLLALLTPALDRAVYQAQLTLCGANQKALVSGGITYAMDHQRAYPGRTPGDEAAWDAMQIKNQTLDIPKEMYGYVAIDAFVDPFLPLELDAGSNDPNAAYMPGYHVYFDWGAVATNVQRMRKLGQAMIFTDPSGEVRHFRTVITDHDVRMLGAWAHTSHPDDEGKLKQYVQQNKPNPYFFNIPIIVPNLTLGQWENFAAPGDRGAIDNNYGFDDGAVIRLDGVKIDDEDKNDDPRITFIVDTDLGQYNSGRKNQLPLVN